jgi:hypothetical protein
MGVGGSLPAVALDGSSRAADEERVEDPRVPPTPPLDEEVMRRLRRRYVRAWGATLAVTAFLLLAAGIAAVIFLLWLVNLLDGSPTIS